MAVVVAAERTAEVTEVLTRQGETVIPIGTVKRRPENGPAVVIKGVEEAWSG
jgi:phosphoribosylformylglycinamidine cyclo-ligase